MPNDRSTAPGTGIATTTSILDARSLVAAFPRGSDDNGKPLSNAADAAFYVAHAKARFSRPNQAPGATEPVGRRAQSVATD